MADGKGCKMTKVLLATGIDELDSGLKNLLIKDGYDVFEAYYRQIHKGYDIAVISANLPGDLNIIEFIYAMRLEDTRVVLLSGGMDKGEREKAISFGVYDILPDPVKAEDVLNVIRKPKTFKDVVEYGPAGTKIDASINPPGGTTCDMSREKIKPGRMISVRDQVISLYSPKGGVGKSTLAVSIAYMLSTRKDLNAKVILVDLDTAFGDAAGILGISPRSYLSDWLKCGLKDDIENYIYHEQKSGLHVLAGSPDPVDAGDVNYRMVDKMLSILSKRYDFVIIDTNPALRAMHKAVFEWSDTILLVSVPRLSALRACKNMEQVFRKMQIPLEKVKLVMNMVPKKATMRVRDALEEMEFAVLGFIPEDPGVRMVENQNGIACMSGSCKQFAAAHYEICNKLLGTKILEKPGRFSLGSLFGRS